MKTFSKILFTMVMAIALTCLLAPRVSAQILCDCDPDVPRLSTLPHPQIHNASLIHQEGRYIYRYPVDTVFTDLHCGANMLDSVDPCNPWILDFYAALWEEENNDCVVLDSIVINWDTTLCQDFRWEVVFPVNYVQGGDYDSIVIHMWMIPHATDSCNIAPLYHCRQAPPNPGLVAPACWLNCFNEMISIYGRDKCPVPNIVICRIEWDKPLPVELASFKSTVSGNNAILNWTTAKETNNSGFTVERYAEGIWTEVGFVKGNGTTTLPVDYAYTDKNLNSGLYGYRLKQVDFNGNFEYLDLNGMVAIGSPDKFALSQNYPNPFNPTTTIVYGIPNNGPVTLKVYDNLGREVRTLVNEPKTAGFYTLTFSAPDLSSGVYFYKLESGNFVTVKRMILMK